MAKLPFCQLPKSYFGNVSSKLYTIFVVFLLTPHINSIHWEFIAPDTFRYFSDGRIWRMLQFFTTNLQNKPDYVALRFLAKINLLFVLFNFSLFHKLGCNT